MSLEEVSVADCDLDDQRKYFRTQFAIQHEKEVSSRENYIISMSQFQRTDLVASVQKNQVALFNLATGQIVEENLIDLSNEQKRYSSAIEIKCSSNSDNELFICLSMGTVLLYDIRTNSPVSKFTDMNIPSHYTCLDVNSNGKLLCVGSEDKKSEVWLSFFDVRNGNLVGGYFDCHESKISQVKFHDSNPNHLITGAIDGLINYYDVSQSDEDDALQCTFNTDRSVASLKWHNDKAISCITDSNELIFYDLEEIDVIDEFDTETITKQMHRKVAMDCHLVTTFNGDEPNSALLLATSNFNDGDCLRTLSYEIGKKELKEHGNFSGNRQIVRCSLYNKKSNYFLTGGEQGLVTLWRDSDSSVTIGDDTATNDNIGKAKSRKIAKANKHKPY